MKVAVWTGIRRVEIKDLVVPEPGPGEVLVRARAVGVCGTDIHIYSGQYPGISPPRVLGHEVCGEIAAVGDGVGDYQVGDRVVVDPILWCGHCEFCRDGEYNLCAADGGKNLIGYSQDGGYAEYFVAPARNLHVFGGGMTFEEAALVDTLACPINAISKVNVDFNSTVVIIGCGAAGLMFVQLARLSGARQVIAVEPNAHRRALAEDLGACISLNPDGPRFREELDDALPDSGVLVIEAAGTPEAARLALESAGKNSSILYFGYVSDVGIDNFSLGRLVFKEVKVFGSVGYTAGNYEQAISLIESKRIDVGKIITHVFTLDEIQKAFHMVEEQSDDLIKAVIKS
ncbi:MAG: zinc-dependent alcohol dehydrogenase [Promethearchaeota archaeon]